jgi:tetratricopeptide (TPR) repeat protein
MNGESTPKSVYDQIYDADTYTLIHLAEHLIDARQIHKLSVLLTHGPEWLNAKYQRLKSDSFFLSDVNMALSIWEVTPSASQLNILLCLHTLRRIIDYRTTLYADTDLRTLVWIGRSEDALGRARLRAEAHIKFQALSEIYQTLAQQGIHREDLISELRQVAYAITEPAFRVTALCSLIGILFNETRVEEVQSILIEVAKAIETITLLDQRNEALGLYAMSLAMTGNTEAARTIIPELGGTLWQVEALSAIATSYAQTGRIDQAHACFEQAWDLSTNIEDSLIRCGVCCDLIVNQANYTDQGLIRFTQLLEEADQIDVAGIKISMISLVASGLAQIGKFEKAQALLALIRHEWTRAITLKDIANALGKFGQIDQAVSVIEQINRFDIRADALRSLATLCAEHGMRDRAEALFRNAQQLLQVTGNIEARLRVEALSAVALGVSRAGFHDIAIQLLENAHRVAAGIDRIHQDAHLAYDALLIAYVKMGEIDLAKSIIAETEEAGWEDDQLCLFASTLAEEGDVDRAAEVISQIRYASNVEAACSYQAIAYIRAGDLAHAEAYATRAAEAEQWTTTFQSLVSKAVERGEFSEYPDIASKISSSRSHLVAALSSLALAFQSEGQLDKSGQTFTQIMNLISDAGDSLQAVEALRYLTTLSAARKDWKRAQASIMYMQNILKEMANSRRLDEAKFILSLTQADLGEVEGAIVTMESIQDAKRRLDACKHIAFTTYRDGNVIVALKILSDVTIDEFLMTIAKNVAQGLDNAKDSYTGLVEAIRIAAWERDDWKMALKAGLDRT